MSQEIIEKLKQQIEGYKENPEWNDEINKIFSEDVPARVNQGEVKMEEVK